MSSFRRSLLIAIVFFMNLTNFVHAQCDSLEKATITSKGNLQVDALNEFARCFLGPDFVKMDSLTKLAHQKAISISYKSGVARSLQNFGLLAYYFEQDAEKALGFYTNARDIYTSLGDSIGVAN